MTEQWKCRCRIVKVAGDYYYEEMDLEEALEVSIQKIPDNMSKEEIQKYVEETINKRIPLSVPQQQVRISYNYEGNKDKMCVIFKSHHSFADGISAYSFMLCMGTEFDRSKMMKFEGLPWLNRMILRLMVPLYIPKIVFKMLTIR